MIPTIGHGYSLEVHTEGVSRSLDAPILRLEFATELADLRRSRAAPLTEHRAKTLVKYPGLRVVLLALNEGARLGEHRSSGALVLQTLTGKLRVKVGNDVLELPPGTFLALEPQRAHEIEAAEETTALLTVTGDSPIGEASKGG